MNDIQAIGETEIILRNAQTLEIEERIVQKNRITPYIWGQIPWGGSSGSFSDVFYGTYTQNLGINNGFGYATRNTFIRISVNPLINSNAVCGYSDGTYLNSIKADAVIPTVGTGLQVFTAFDSNGPYFQFNGRYNQPASNRNVGAVLLSNRKLYEASDYGDAFTGYDTPASYLQTYTIANMQTACTQTTSQIMDIYYRIFFTSSTKSNTEVYNWLIAKSLDVGSSQPYSNTGEFCSSYRIPSDFKSMYWNSSTTCLAGNNIKNYTTRPLVSYRSYDFSAYAKNVNRFVNSWVNCPNFGAYNNFNHPTKFGNTFGTNANSTSYMQDVNNLASGNGTLAVTGVWNPSPTSNSNGLYYPTSWPKQMILTVTDSGKASDSTAKFNYSERPICPGSSLPYLSSLSNNYGPLGDPSVNWPYWLACRTIRYDNCSIILIGYDRIIVYNIPGGKTYTITGSFTKLCQCAVSGTKIYMACRNTGLWVVDPTVSLTPTKVSLTTNNACYGVDAARDGVVWALTDGGLYKLNSSGTVTANYTSSTSVALNVSLNSWADFTYVNGLVVDKYVSSQLVLCADLAFHTYASTNKSILWFDETGGSTSGFNFTWADTLQSTNLINIGVYNNSVYTSPRQKLGPNSCYNFCFKKNTTISYYRDDTALNSVPMDDLLSTETATFSFYNTTNGFYVTDSSLSVLRQLSGTNGSTVAAQGSLVAYDGSTKQSTIPVSSLYTYSYWFTQTMFGWLVYMGNGIIVRIPYLQTDNNTGYYTDNVYSLFDYTTKWTGVPFDSTFTTTYGWNGSAWVKGSTTGKPMGTGSHTLPGNASGITVQFTDPASGTSFVATDKYTTILYDGFFKDNATIATMRHDFYMCPTDQGLTDLESNTIPSAPLTTPKTGYVTTIINATSAPTVNGDSSLTFTGVGQCPIMYDAPLYGDWEVDMIVPASSSAFPTVMTFGVVSDGANLVHCSATPIANITVSSYLGKTLRIVKVGNVITWYQGTTSISSQTLTTNQAGSYGRYAIRVYVGSTTASFTVPPVNIISNNTSSTYLPTLKIGNSTNSSGAYNSRFFRVDVESIQSGDVKINGVAATVLTDGTPPTTGQCSILPYSGYITFSTADIGKSVSTSLTVLYP